MYLPTKMAFLIDAIIFLFHVIVKPTTYNKHLAGNVRYAAIVTMAAVLFIMCHLVDVACEI